MPRTSERKRFIKELEELVSYRRHLREMRFLWDEEDSWEDDLDIMYLLKLEKAEGNRYTFRPPRNRTKPRRWEHYLYNTDMINESEFLSLFRMTRRTFWKLLGIINDHNQDAEDYKSLSEVNLMVLLKYLGTNGNGASGTQLGIFFGIGYGTVLNYITEGLRAVLRLNEKVISWPDEAERNQISARILNGYGFPNCIGIIDGTLFPLEYKPTMQGEDFFTRKSNYAVHSLIICDDQARVRGITLGFPGSYHDNRVWLSCKYFGQKQLYFDEREYLLGDSAFKASSILVPAFKKPFGGTLDPYKTNFNSMLAKLRIRSEHCIGLMKGRFQCLKGIRIVLTRKHDMTRINRIVLACAVLHNLMLVEQEPSLDDWIDDDEFNQVDDASGLDMDIDGNNRRTAIFSYICENRL